MIRLTSNATSKEVHHCSLALKSILPSSALCCKPPNYFCTSVGQLTGSCVPLAKQFIKSNYRFKADLPLLQHYHITHCLCIKIPDFKVELMTTSTLLMNHHIWEMFMILIMSNDVFDVYTKDCKRLI